MIETCADFHFVAPVMILTLLNHTNCNFKRIKAILHREEALSGRIFIKFALNLRCCCSPPIVPPDFFDYISIELNFRSVFRPWPLINVFCSLFFRALALTRRSPSLARSLAFSCFALFIFLALSLSLTLTILCTIIMTIKAINFRAKKNLKA